MFFSEKQCFSKKNSVFPFLPIRLAIRVMFVFTINRECKVLSTRLPLEKKGNLSACFV